MAVLCISFQCNRTFFYVAAGRKDPSGDEYLYDLRNRLTDYYVGMFSGKIHENFAGTGYHWIICCIERVLGSFGNII